MGTSGFLRIALFLLVLAGLAPPLGRYVARVFAGRPCGLDRLLGGAERLIYRLCGVRPDTDMTWTAYAAALLAFNAVGILALYLLLRLQGLFAFGPAPLPGIPPHLAFNAAVSFATNTNWQSYGGEWTLAPLTQMLGLTVQNFVSAATGLAVLAALIRGLVRRGARGLGNFWTDLVRSTLYILLPLSLLLALLLASQGVVQTFSTRVEATLLAPPTGADGSVVATQTLVLGPVASQVAIKQLGTNGGGYFNVNSAHPFENPTPLSGFLEMLAILLVPAALCHTFGHLVRDARQGWAVLAAMALVFLASLAVCVRAEQAGNPRLAALGLDQQASALQPGGNMEGKEVRFGIVDSALWATATTAASNGSVNAMHDSFTPLGGLVPMWLMQLGEVVFGGVGSGLYGVLLFVVVAVFIAGLMVGRTPEYLGKKIGAHEMKMAALGILVPPMVVLTGTAIAAVAPAGVAGLANPGPHGFSEILYAFSSAGNNNGSAFAGLSANTPFYNLALGLAMLFGRYWVAVPALALAGSLAGKGFTPPGAGTLPTHTPLFVALLVGTILLVGALSFLPALALGPIVEHLQMVSAP
ncbi:MAG: potassium-transporting ATPase subunit KdpA [Thermoanaerobaculia bacterium]|nr:potassium-transporting ATPase subunit KdpA [Thermoanaerobaculia bacterium]